MILSLDPLDHFFLRILSKDGRIKRKLESLTSTSFLTYPSLYEDQLRLKRSNEQSTKDKGPRKYGSLKVTFYGKFFGSACSYDRVSDASLFGPSNDMRFHAPISSANPPAHGALPKLSSYSEVLPKSYQVLPLQMPRDCLSSFFIIFFFIFHHFFFIFHHCFNEFHDDDALEV